MDIGPVCRELAIDSFLGPMGMGANCEFVTLRRVSSGVSQLTRSKGRFGGTRASFSFTASWAESTDRDRGILVVVFSSWHFMVWWAWYMS